MKKGHIAELANDSKFANLVLRELLALPKNVSIVKKLAFEDIAFARFCERIGFETGSNWREESRKEVLANRRAALAKP